MQASPDTPHPPLEDRFGRRVSYLRLSVTDRCNFRCVYCMPAEGIALQPAASLLTFEEIEEIVGAFAALGVERIRLTGGEPLVRRDLPTLIQRLRALPGVREIVLTTNGHLLRRHAAALRDAGLAGVTVSLDSLRPERFARITRGGDLDRVLDGIQAAQDAGFGPVKLNAVIIRGFNDDEILDLAAWAVERRLLLRLIEFMPIGEDTVWGEVAGGGCVPAAELRAVLASRWTLTPEGMRPGAGPARYLRLEGPDTPQGARVGVISAVTECFCDACNRVRLTPQGGLRACLADDREANLRDLLRSTPPGPARAEALRHAVARALGAKEATHAFTLDGGNVTSKQMVSIGG